MGELDADRDVAVAAYRRENPREGLFVGVRIEPEAAR